jgi:filamentous hemagglutinin
MGNTYYIAKADGNWGDAGTWDGAAPGGVVPLGSVVTIPAGITVTIPGGVTVAITNGHLYLSGNLAVAGTLALTINGPRDRRAPDYFDSLIDAQGAASLSVASGGQVNIVSEGYASGTTYYPVQAIVLSATAKLTNRGSIAMSCTTYTDTPFPAIGRGYGVRLHDSSTLDNFASIAIASHDTAGDGYGPAFGIYCNGGTLRNNSGATITSIAPPAGDAAGGTIRIEQPAQFINAGSFVNFGQFWNDALCTSSGTITQMYPWASYTGTGTVGGAGSVQLQGTLTSALSLDRAMPGQSKFSVPSGQPLTVNAPFTVPATYTLDCRANISGTSTFTNNGTLKWDLSNAQYSGTRYIEGNGSVILSGTLSSAGEFDLTKISRRITIPSAVTVAAGALLLLPSDATLTIASGGSLTTQAGSGSTLPGILSFGGTVQNNGSLVNNGILKYQFPSGTLAGAATALTGSGQVALKGGLSASLSLASLPGTTYLIMAADMLDLYGYSLTVSSNKTLTVQGGSSPGALTYGNATIFIEGALTNNGSISSTINGTISIEGTLTNNGSISSNGNGTIVHCFPNASYSGAAPGNIAEIRLKGTAALDVNLGTLGYGTGIPFRISSDAGYAVTVNGTLTVSQNITLLCAGNLTAGTIQNNGTLVYSFDQSSITCTTYSGSGAVCLNGMIGSKTFADVTAPFSTVTAFKVRANDELNFTADTTIPDATTLSIAGRLSVREGSTLTLGTPPATPAICATVELTGAASLANSGTIALRNTRSIGLWFKNMSVGTPPYYPSNLGTIDASVDQPLFSSDANCAVKLENTKLENSGTIKSGPVGQPTIYCNSGLICGGTLIGPNPAGSGMRPSTGTTYSPTC